MLFLLFISANILMLLLISAPVSHFSKYAFKLLGIMFGPVRESSILQTFGIYLMNIRSIGGDWKQFFDVQ